MPITKEKDGYRFVHHYRVPDKLNPGKTTPRKVSRLFPTRIEAISFELEFKSRLAGGSLTAPIYKELHEHYLKNKGNGGFNAACYDRALSQLGHLRVNEQFPRHYLNYCELLKSEGKASNTVNNYRTVIRSILNYSYRIGLLEKIPIRDYGIEQNEERDRILNDEETAALLRQLQKDDSYLIEAVRFSLVNPIRKNDLFNLKRENIVSEGGRYFVRFMPSKTADSTKKRTYCTLVNIDPWMLERWMSLPVDCPYLFPKVRGPRWEKIGNIQKHWTRIKRDAKIADFHWHDLKHCAVTHMLLQGYTYEALRKLGIQFTERTASLYDNRSPLAIVQQVEGCKPELRAVNE